MVHSPFELRGSSTDLKLLDDAAQGLAREGLLGLLAGGGHRARRTRVPGSAAVDGFRWRLLDNWNPTWWPQGVAVGEFEGVPLAIVSWFAQPRRGIQKGSRITVVDLRDPQRPRYHHVLLVSARQDAAGTGFDPVVVHAGGIVWSGDRLLVSATFGGIREFHLSDILRAPSRGLFRRSAGPFGYRYLLPQRATFRPPGAKSEDRMRYSFIALETSSAEVEVTEVVEVAPSTAQDAGAPGNSVSTGNFADDLRLVAGEYSEKEGTRLARMRLGGDRTVIDESHIPGIQRMQGVVLHDGTWYVNASRGDKLGGDLWVGTPGAMKQLEGVLPIGPEDLAVWPERRQLWSVTEFPGKRWVFAMDLGAL